MSLTLHVLHCKNELLKIKRSFFVYFYIFALPKLVNVLTNPTTNDSVFLQLAPTTASNAHTSWDLETHNVPNVTLATL